MRRGCLICLGSLLLLTGCASQSGAVKAPSVVERKQLPVVAATSEMSPSEAQVMAAVNAENNVFFGQGSSTVDAVGEQTLQRHAQRLKSDPKLVVTLTGYTDDQGSRSYNLAIAEQRVNAVYQLLRRAGVPATQMRRYGVGAEKVSQYCRSPECRQTMRRVELVYAK